MKFEIEILAGETDADLAGEALLRILCEDDRWGYSTRDFEPALIVQELSVDLETDLVPATLCCGCFAKIEFDKINKYKIVNRGFTVFLHWDGDGTIVIYHNSEGWLLYNSDCKKAYDWEWVEAGNWVYSLPADYYDNQ